jgi:hypothetical protein
MRRATPCLFLVVLLGCAGSEKPKYPVRGTVTFDGAPVEEGDILFLPGQEGGRIEDGAFEFLATPGSKRVEIRASKLDPKLKNPRGEPTPVDYIPPKFNTQSTLKAEVTASGPNQFTFDLKSR